MSTETRIGIVAGLLIVVVASVYFFYGSSRRDEEVLIAATPKPGALKIPVSNEKPPTKTAGGVSNRPTSGGPIAQNPARNPVFNPPQSTSGAKPIVLTPIAPSHMGAVGPTADKIAASSGIDKYKWTPPAGNPSAVALGPAPNTTTAAPTPLRTSPSPILVEATRGNLDAEPKPVMPPSMGVPVKSAEKKAAEIETGRVKLEPETVTKLPTARGDAPDGMQRHVVVKGDTLTGLAKQYLGSTKKQSEIVAANPELKGRRKLKPGETILIPQPTAAAEHSGGLDLTPAMPIASDKTYTVEDGDTIYAIAKKTLGDSKRWKEVFELNKDQLRGDPRRLKAGMTLKLPAA
ncbi:MAG TPA: LysM peptidoglycan-binding domain-containing protein [Phycisphaerae bacterium]|nr:LysM peptidoglycan-binding domain-containing protein [Phycisphaerae bacterium]